MVDIEATGGLVTGGVIAGAVEKPTGKAGDAHAGTCSDCGEPVDRNFCANCGQPTHVHRSLLHLGEEVLHGVMHFDARIWRTLPLLLLNPGKLTREWIAGRRTRYVSPLAIFLFTVFLMFFLLSFGGGGIVEQEPLEQRIVAARDAMAEERAELDESLDELTAAQAAEAAAPVEDRDVHEGTTRVAQNKFGNAAQNVAVATEDLTRLERLSTAGPRTDGYEVGSWQAEIADAVENGRVNVGIGDKKTKEKILNKLANPEFALYKIQQTLYKFAFLLVPLSIPFVWLLFAWKRGFTWYDHGVFVLYSLTFMAILSMAILALDVLGGNGKDWREGTAAFLGSLLTLSVPVHMFAQLKGTYGLSIFSALWRTFALLNFCFFVMVFFILGIIVLGLTS